MIQPVTYVEINSPDLPRTRTFMEEVFDWHLEPFAAADYLVAAAGDGGGVDSGLMPSQDGNPRTIPVIRVDDLEASLAAVVACGGKSWCPPSRSVAWDAVATSPIRSGYSWDCITMTRGRLDATGVCSGASSFWTR